MEFKPYLTLRFAQDAAWADAPATEPGDQVLYSPVPPVASVDDATTKYVSYEDSYPLLDPASAPAMFPTLDIKPEQIAVVNPVQMSNLSLASYGEAGMEGWLTAIFGPKLVKSSMVNEEIISYSRLVDVLATIPTATYHRLKLSSNVQTLKRIWHEQHCIRIALAGVVVIDDERYDVIGIEGHRIDGSIVPSDRDVVIANSERKIQLEITAMSQREVPTAGVADVVRLIKIPPFVKSPVGFPVNAPKPEFLPVIRLGEEIRKLPNDAVDQWYDRIVNSVADYVRLAAPQPKSFQPPAELSAIAEYNSVEADKRFYEVMPGWFRHAIFTFHRNAVQSHHTRIYHAKGIDVTSIPFDGQDLPDELKEIWIAATDREDENFKYRHVGPYTIKVSKDAGIFHPNLGETWDRTHTMKWNTQPTADVRHLKDKEDRSEIPATVVNFIESMSLELDDLTTDAEIPTYAFADILSAAEAVADARTKTLTAAHVKLAETAFKCRAGVEMFFRFQLVNQMLAHYQQHKRGFCVFPINGFAAFGMVKSAGSVSLMKSFEVQIYFSQAGKWRSYGFVLHRHMMNSWLGIYYRTIAAVSSYIESTLPQWKSETVKLNLIKNARSLIVIGLINTNFYAKTLEGARYMFATGYAVHSDIIAMTQRVLDYPAGSPVEALFLYRTVKFGLCLKACVNSSPSTAHRVALGFERYGMDDVEHWVNFSYACNIFVKQVEHMDDHTLLNSLSVLEERDYYQTLKSQHPNIVLGLHSRMGFGPDWFEQEMTAEINDLCSFTPEEDEAGLRKRYTQHLGVELIVARKHHTQIDHSAYHRTANHSLEELINARGACSSQNPDRRISSTIEISESLTTYFPEASLDLKEHSPEPSIASVSTALAADVMIARGAPIKILMKSKPDQKGNRDIWGLTGALRCLALSVEEVSRLIKSSDDYDSLDKLTKDERAEKMITSGLKVAKEREAVVSIDSLDAKRFGPNFIPSLLIEQVIVNLSDDESAQQMRLFQTAYHRKVMVLNKRLVAMIQGEMACARVNGSFKQRIDRIRTMVGAERELPSENNMPMGILHSTTSMVNANNQHLMTDVLVKLGAWYTDATVTADDAIRVTVHPKELTRAKIVFACNAVSRAFCIMENRSKRVVSGVFGEFNSKYYVQSRVLSIPFKTQIGCISVGQGEDEYKDRLTALGATANTIAEGASYLSACILSCIRMALHLAQWGYWGYGFNSAPELGGRLYIEPLTVLTSGVEALSMLKLPQLELKRLVGLFKSYRELVIEGSAIKWPGSGKTADELTIIRPISSAGTVSLSMRTYRNKMLQRLPAISWTLNADYYDPNKGAFSINRLKTKISLGGADVAGLATDVDAASRMGAKCYTNKKQYKLTDGHPAKRIEQYSDVFSAKDWHELCQTVLPSLEIDLPADDDAVYARWSRLHTQVNDIFTHIQSFTTLVRTERPLHKVLITAESHAPDAIDLHLAVMIRYLNAADYNILKNRRIVPDRTTGPEATMSLDQCVSLTQSLIQGWSQIYRPGTKMLLHSRSSVLPLRGVVDAVLLNNYAREIGLRDPSYAPDLHTPVIGESMLMSLTYQTTLTSQEANDAILRNLTDRQLMSPTAGDPHVWTRADPLTLLRMLNSTDCPALLSPAVCTSLKQFSGMPSTWSGWYHKRIKRVQSRNKTGLVIGALLVFDLISDSYGYYTFDTRFTIPASLKKPEYKDTVFCLPIKDYRVVSFQGFNCILTEAGPVPFAPLLSSFDSRQPPVLTPPPLVQERAIAVTPTAFPMLSRTQAKARIRDPKLTRRDLISLIPSCLHLMKPSSWLNLGGVYSPWLDVTVSQKTVEAFSSDAKLSRMARMGSVTASQPAPSPSPPSTPVTTPIAVTATDLTDALAGLTADLLEEDAADEDLIDFGYEADEPPPSVAADANDLDQLIALLSAPKRKAADVPTIAEQRSIATSLARAGMSYESVIAIHRSCKTLVQNIAHFYHADTETIVELVQTTLPETLLREFPSYAWEAIFWNATLADMDM